MGALSFDRIIGAPGSGTAVLIDMAYPVSDLVLLGLTLGALAAQGWKPSPAWWYLSAGIVTMIAADINFC